MMNEHDKSAFPCKKFQQLGYAPKRRIKLYGEEFDLVSNPASDGTGYAVEGISRKFGGARHLRLPLSVVHMIERELLVLERTGVLS
jgi:hypothetical protein